MSTISVVINTYNAERILDKCLKSVEGADEILICDMYSTDKTIEIAKRYNCKIIFHEHTGIVEPARNYALKSASKEWILILDADEIVTPELWIKLKSLALNPINNIFSYLIPKENFFIGKSISLESPRKRFWKNGSCFYTGTHIHEPIIQKEGKERKLNGLNVKILHYSISSINEIYEKNGRYTNFELSRFDSKNQTFSLFKLIFRPKYEFLKYYFFTGAFLKGIHGYVFAKMKAQYKFLQWIKLYEKEFKNSNQDIVY